MGQSVSMHDLRTHSLTNWLIIHSLLHLLILFLLIYWLIHSPLYPFIYWNRPRCLAVAIVFTRVFASMNANDSRTVPKSTHILDLITILKQSSFNGTNFYCPNSFISFAFSALNIIYTIITCSRANKCSGILFCWMPCIKLRSSPSALLCWVKLLH